MSCEHHAQAVQRPLLTRHTVSRRGKARSERAERAACSMVASRCWHAYARNEEKASLTRLEGNDAKRASIQLFASGSLSDKCDGHRISGCIDRQRWWQSEDIILQLEFENIIFVACSWRSDAFIVHVRNMSQAFFFLFFSQTDAMRNNAESNYIKWLKIEQIRLHLHSIHRYGTMTRFSLLECMSR